MASKPSYRESVLTGSLLMLVFGGMFVVAVGIMGMFVIHAVVVFGLLFAFGLAHWLLWGRALSNEVAAEREVEETTAPPDDRFTDGPHGPTRY